MVVVVLVLVHVLVLVVFVVLMRASASASASVCATVPVAFVASRRWSSETTSASFSCLHSQRNANL